MSDGKVNIERLGPYRVTGKLGRGGMGTVYRAVEVETDEPAAVKVLAPALAEEEGFRERFKAEIETLRKLKHPNIVRIFGFGQEGDHLFYAMELVEGTSIEEELRQGRRYSWLEVADVGVQICRALRHAHDRGVTHRDIKPANLLIGEDGHVKLSDFGIARLFGVSSNTAASSVVGTAEYMAPEQATGGAVGPRADLYSLGAVFYAMLAGRPPLTANSMAEVMKKKLSEKPEPVSRYADGVPDEFELIIEELLEMDPDNRIGEAKLLSRRLEAMQHALARGPADTQEESVDNLPVTQDGELRDDSPRMDETKSTSEFVVEGEVDTVDLTPDEPQMAPAPSTYTPIAEDELDAHAVDRSQGLSTAIQTASLLLALAAIGVAAWYFMQPPSANTLYDEISKAAETGSVESLTDVEGHIDEFLARFPDDERCDTLREYQREIDLYRLERSFERRARGMTGIEGLSPVERDYLEAINYLRIDPDRGLAMLSALVDLYGEEKPTGRDAKCIELARRRIEQLNEKLAEQTAERLAAVNKLIDRADELRETDPDRASRMYESVIELYGQKPWADAAVRRAAERLGQ